MIADKIAEDLGEGAGKAGRPGLDELLHSRNVDVVTFRDWQNIDSAEIARAMPGMPREKFTEIHEMVSASRQPAS